MKFQQRLKALQFQRYDFMARTSRGGIACDIPCTPSSDVREGRMQGLRGLAAVPAGSGKAWPDNEPTRRAAEQRPGPTGVEGAGGSGGHGLGAGGWRQGLAAVPVGGGGARPRCRWVAAGPGRASRSTTPSRQARVWRSRGRAAAHRHTQRQGPTKHHNGAPGTPAAPQATQQPGTATPRLAYKKPTSGSDVSLWWS